MIRLRGHTVHTFCHSEDQAVNIVSRIFSAFCKNYAKPINTLCRQSAEFLKLNTAVQLLNTGLESVKVQIGTIILV